MSESTGSPNRKQPWHAHADALVGWAVRLINRSDCCGGYYQKDGNIHQTTRKAVNLPALLRRHFQATRADHLVGLHTTSIENTSRFVAFDIDAHSEGDDPNRNRQTTRRLVETLRVNGLEPITEDSNGRGGFHVWVFFSAPIPTATAHALCEYVKGEAEAADAESFPKQPNVEPGGYGNWIRLPGRHHSREHWSRIYDEQSQSWLDGDAAAQALLAAPLNEPQAVEALRDILPKPLAPWPEPESAARNNGERLELARRTLDFIAFGASGGERNDRLFKAAADMRGCHYTEVEALEKLLPAATRAGLSESEARDAIASAYKRQRNPARPQAEKPARAILPFRPFPLHALPDPMRGFAEAVAGATGTDPAFAALAALVVAAGCIGNRVAALVKQGWVEPAVLWGAIVGRSGTTKTPVLKLTRRAVVELFKAERAAHQEAVQEYEIASARYAIQLAEWKKAQREGPATDPPLAPEPPAENRLLVSDITSEKLGAMLEDNPLGLLLVRDELAAWIGAFDRYAAGGKGSDAPVWLSFYDAASVVIDRKGGKQNYFVERAAVSVLGTIQPGTLARVFGTPEREAGLLARVLLVIPPEKPAKWTDAELPEAVADRWKELLAALLALPPGADDAGNPRPRFIRIGRDAMPRWIEWHDTHAQECAEIQDDDLRAHFAKLKGACVRFALVFACVDVAVGGRAVGFLGPEIMERAIAVTEWFKYEARRVYATLSETGDERDRRALADWIANRGGTTTARDLAHGLRRFRGQVTAAKAALDDLAAAGVGVWEHLAPGQQGGRPSAIFRLKAVSPSPKPQIDRAEAGFGDGDSSTSAELEPRAEAAHGEMPPLSADAKGELL